MTSKAQISTVKFDHSQPKGLMGFTIRSKGHNNNIIAQKAFAFQSQTQKREIPIEKLHAHNIKILQWKNDFLMKLIIQYDEGMNILLKEVESAQTDLFRSRSKEKRLYAHIRRLQHDNAHLKELLTQSDKGQEILLQRTVSTQAELSKTQSMEAQKEAENQKLREESESIKELFDNNSARLRTSIRRSYENSLRQLESDNDRIEDEVMEVEEENGKLKEENQALAKKLLEANEELSKFKAQSKESKESKS